MKVLGFAHVTFCVPYSGSKNRGSNGPDIIDELVFNHPEKLDFQLRFHSHHRIVVRSKLTDSALIEFSSYPDSVSYPLVTALVCWYRGLGVLGAKSRIRSRSFSSKFLHKLSALLGLEIAVDGSIVKVPTLGRLGFVEITGSRFAAKFRDNLDELGPVALAFWVDSLEDVSSSNILKESGVDALTQIFEISVGKRVLKIRFVKIGGVIIELLSR
jgi:hypothetical protein